ncbi:beta-aspartyl-peptidase, partial [Burkholderia thailandensis]|nr:beta-aspartyl-peptidase [Burkholderia thailandensis]
MPSPATVAIPGAPGPILPAAIPADAEPQYRAELNAILAAAQKLPADGGSAPAPAGVAVRRPEVCPLFTGGPGAASRAGGPPRPDPAR